uniref:Uncharacterized protein n=1 Tax=Rhizophora mucronata TaxID=61149 RepID=A0A2P2PMZ8_RHIMU
MILLFCLLGRLMIGYSSRDG